MIQSMKTIHPTLVIGLLNYEVFKQESFYQSMQDTKWQLTCYLALPDEGLSFEKWQLNIFTRSLWILVSTGVTNPIRIYSITEKYILQNILHWLAYHEVLVKLCHCSLNTGVSVICLIVWQQNFPFSYNSENWLMLKLYPDVQNALLESAPGYQ